MPDIDPITREALRRASQMHSHRPARKNNENKSEEKPKNPQSEKRKPHISDDPIKAFFKDKEESMILLLVLLLMDEKCEPSLLLALLYLLI